ncbi:MAG: DUF3343 domain-containing protein [Deltaproteobacteria bacterium]|nr:DUF3343 domain-containing protein [Deltaproteobacteria bacterium]
MKALITFDSTSHALSGETALQDKGLAVSLMGRPVELGGDCGFCLRVEWEDLDIALIVLSEAGFIWQGAYLDFKHELPRYRLIRPSPTT